MHSYVYPAFVQYTGLSCKALSHNLLVEGHEYVSSEKLLCQDDLEQHFSDQQSTAGHNRAPTVGQLLKATLAGEVAKDVDLPALENSRGRVNRRQEVITVNNKPLKKKLKK